MPYNSLISRSDASALIPEEASREIIKGIADTSPLLRLARRLPDMSRSQYRMPVLSALATAYFVDPSDTGLKQTTEISWANKYIDAEEIACIVPIPEAVLEDADYDIWSEVRPEIVKAFDVVIAGAVLNGTGIPASWTSNLGAAGILAGANAASQVVSLAAFADAYEAILGETNLGANGVYMLVEEDGFNVDANIAHLSLKGVLRNTRSTTGEPIFKTMPQDATRYELDGAEIVFPKDGVINPATALMFSGEWGQLVYSIRTDIRYKVLTEATIYDNAGNVVYALAQKDMVALRAVMRLGFALPNPINRVNATEATRYPFAVLTA